MKSEKVLTLHNNAHQHAQPNTPTTHHTPHTHILHIPHTTHTHSHYTQHTHTHTAPRVRACAFQDPKNGELCRHMLVVASSDTDVQIVRYIPLSSFPSGQVEMNNFHQVKRMIGRIGNVSFSTYSQTFVGQDPVLTLVNPWCT